MSITVCGTALSEPAILLDFVCTALHLFPTIAYEDAPVRTCARALFVAAKLLRSILSTQGDGTGDAAAWEA